MSVVLVKENEMIFCIGLTLFFIAFIMDKNCTQMRWYALSDMFAWIGVTFVFLSLLEFGWFNML